MLNAAQFKKGTRHPQFVDKVTPATDLSALLAALAPFLRCEAATRGGTCWPRCDGPERRALAEAVKAIYSVTNGDRLTGLALNPGAEHC